MVMPTNQQEVDETVQIIEPVDVGEETEQPLLEGDDSDVDPSGEAPAPAADGAPVVEATTASSIAEPPPPAAPEVDQKALDELRQHRVADQQRQWREKVTKTAQGYERQLQEAGYLPEQARDQARRYVAQEQKFRDQEGKAAEFLGMIEGRQNAAMHYLQKEGLADKQVIADLQALQRTNSIQEMEQEAKRMKRERALIAENARLKQGRVPPQTFDNSQGAAEATSNVDRLLEAYNNGDRSEQAVRAARRMAFGA